MRLILFLLIFALSLPTLDAQAQKKAEKRVRFTAIIDIRQATKDGIYLNGYVVNIPYEQLLRLNSKLVSISGKITVVKGVENELARPIEQGRETERKHILKPRIKVIGQTGGGFDAVPNTIEKIDSLVQENENVRGIVVVKNRHNESTFCYSYFFDTATLQLVKCQYELKAKQPVDSILETISYYLEKAQIIAFRHQVIRNDVLVNSVESILKSAKGRLNAIDENLDTDISEKEINYRAEELLAYWPLIVGRLHEGH